METLVKVVERDDQPALEINARCTVMNMPMVIPKSFKSIAEYMQSHKLKIEHMPYVRYLNVNWDDVGANKLVMFLKMFSHKWDMLIGIPVTTELPDNGIIRNGKFPGGSYLETLHTGPYSKVGTSYKRLTDFAKAEHLTFGNESIEIYLNDPREVAKQDLQTRILVPLKH